MLFLTDDLMSIEAFIAMDKFIWELRGKRLRLKWWLYWRGEGR